MPKFSKFWNPLVNFHQSDRFVNQNEAFHDTFETFETKDTTQDPWKSFQFDADEAKVLRTHVRMEKSEFFIELFPKTYPETYLLKLVIKNPT